MTSMLKMKLSPEGPPTRLASAMPTLLLICLMAALIFTLMVSWPTVAYAGNQDNSQGPPAGVNNNGNGNGNGNGSGNGNGNGNGNANGNSGNGADVEIHETLDPYIITLISKSYDPNTDLSKWHYRVTSPGGAKRISHWALELCHEEPVDCDAQPDPNSHTVSDSTTPTPWEVNCDPSISNPFWGIKWDIEFEPNDGNDEDDVTKHFYLYLEGNWQQGPVSVALKAGLNEHYGTVQGPICQPDEEEELNVTNLGDLVIVQSQATGIEVALTSLGAGNCSTCAPFSANLKVAFTTPCSSYQVKAYYTVQEASGSSPPGASSAIQSQFDPPVLKIDRDGGTDGTNYEPLGYGSQNAVLLSGFSNDNCTDPTSTSPQCASFPVAVDLARLGNMTSGWKYEFKVHVKLDCQD